MLKRTKEVVQAVAESAGLIDPSLADATAGAEKYRQELVTAQRAVDDAVAALEAGHDVSAADTEISRLESILADARLTAERAQRSCRAAERRLTKAVDAETAKTKAAAIVKRDEALAVRASAAAEIDRLAVEMAEQCQRFDAQIGALNECMRDGVAGNSMRTLAHALAMHALEKAGALRSTWIGDPRHQPGAVALAERDAGSILAVA